MVYVNKRHNELTLETVNKILLRVGNPKTRNFDKQLLKGEYNFDDFNFFDTYNSYAAEGQSTVDSMISAKFKLFEKVMANNDSRLISLFDLRDANNIELLSESFNGLADIREFKMALNTNKQRTLELTMMYMIEEFSKDYNPVFRLNGSVFVDESDKQFISKLPSRLG